MLSRFSTMYLTAFPLPTIKQSVGHANILLLISIPRFSIYWSFLLEPILIFWLENANFPAPLPPPHLAVVILLSGERALFPSTHSAIHPSLIWTSGFLGFFQWFIAIPVFNYFDAHISLDLSSGNLSKLALCSYGMPLSFLSLFLCLFLSFWHPLAKFLAQ